MEAKSQSIDDRLRQKEHGDHRIPHSQLKRRNLPLPDMLSTVATKVSTSHAIASLSGLHFGVYLPALDLGA